MKLFRAFAFTLALTLVTCSGIAVQGRISYDTPGGSASIGISHRSDGKTIIEPKVQLSSK